MIDKISINNQIIGHVIHSIEEIDDTKTLYIHQFRIFSEFQGKGYFKILLERARDVAGDQGAESITLVVNSKETDEDWLYALYERYGFVFNQNTGRMRLTL